MFKPLPIALSALTLAACANVTAPTTIELTRQEAHGYDFAKAHCAGCHGTTANAASPNPESPSFEAVANQPGLTAGSLHRFLKDSHNFPAVMNFSVGPTQVDDLTAYVLTLRKPGYKPDI